MLFGRGVSSLQRMVGRCMCLSMVTMKLTSPPPTMILTMWGWIFIMILRRITLLLSRNCRLKWHPARRWMRRLLFQQFPYHSWNLRRFSSRTAMAPRWIIGPMTRITVRMRWIAWVPSMTVVMFSMRVMRKPRSLWWTKPLLLWWMVWVMLPPKFWIRWFLPPKR